jgi:OOP family OmpA-OmpF porin
MNVKRILLISLLCASTGFAATAAAQNDKGYVVRTTGGVVRDGSGDCVRNPFREGPNQDCEPAPEPVAVVEPEPVYQKVTLQADTFFDFDKSTLKPTAQQTLDEVVAGLSGTADVSIQVVGHTDSVGTEVYNLGLSERRAGAVTEYLISRGVSPSAIEAAGMGETQPIASNSTPDGRAQNRRVEIEIRGMRQG